MPWVQQSLNVEVLTKTGHRFARAMRIPTCQVKDVLPAPLGAMTNQVRANPAVICSTSQSKDRVTASSCAPRRSSIKTGSM